MSETGSHSAMSRCPMSVREKNTGKAGHEVLGAVSYEADHTCHEVRADTTMDIDMMTRFPDRCGQSGARGLR